MQVIEKVKVVPEGYNGAGMDGYGRRDVNGKANAGLTLGIIGTATTGMNKEVTVNVIDMMKVEVMMEVMATMKKNVCFLCKCLE